MEVVQLRPQGSALEIAKQLRSVADALDRGDVTAETVICVLFEEDDTWPPHVYAWGHAPTYHDTVGRLNDAADHLLTQRRFAQLEE